VFDTGDKLIAGVMEMMKILNIGDNLSPVTITPPIIREKN
jgi:hypothetical protein